jgi:hypothetical protein
MIVSVTSRNARGADLLATDSNNRKAWSIEVKTNRKAKNWWLLNAHFQESSSPTHVYVFINLQGNERPNFYVVPSSDVAEHGGRVKRTTGSIWYYFSLDTSEDKKYYCERWRVFGRHFIQA